MLLWTQECVMWKLLSFFWECTTSVDEEYVVQQDKEAAIQVIRREHVVPIEPNLLRCFDPTTVSVETGNNALHEMFRMFKFSNPSSWNYKLVQLFIAHGVSVHAKNKQGHTPLLVAASCSSENSSAVSLLLLLKHDADVNAQDNAGDGVLHHFVRNGALGVLEVLLGGSYATRIDYFSINRDGQTAATLAAIRRVHEPHSKTMQRSHNLLLSQQTLWMQHLHPLMQRCVEKVLIPDLAALVLAYIDDSGPAFLDAATTAATVPVQSSVSSSSVGLVAEPSIA